MPFFIILKRNLLQKKHFGFYFGQFVIWRVIQAYVSFNKSFLCP